MSLTASDLAEIRKRHAEDEAWRTGFGKKSLIRSYHEHATELHQDRAALLSHISSMGVSEEALAELWRSVDVFLRSTPNYCVPVKKHMDDMRAAMAAFPATTPPA